MHTTLRRRFSPHRGISISSSFSLSFFLGFLVAMMLTASVFFLLYANKTATAGYMLRGLQNDQSALITELEKWSNIEIKNSVISNMSKSALAENMYKSHAIIQIKDQQVASR